MLALAWGVVVSQLDGGDPDVAPAAGRTAAAAELGQAAGGGAPGAAPAGASAVVRRASASVAGRAQQISMRELTDALSAAQRGGGSPAAVVTSRTALRAAPDGPVLERIGAETEFGSPRVHAVVSHEGEWLEVLAAELPNGRTGWITSDHVDVAGVDLSLHATLGGRALEVRRGGRVVRRVPVAIGDPATPTPTGTFAVTDKLRMTGDGSPYGCCVLALTGRQPSVPQGWSGGDRLAVHATPDAGTIGHAVSLGCLRAGDADMRWLMDRVPLGTPVTVAP